MATGALPTPVPPTINSTGTSLGVVGTAGATAGMTVAVAGAGNGKTFPNNGSQARLLVYNGNAAVKYITPLLQRTVGGVAPTSANRNIAAGAIQVFRFDSDYEDANGNVTVEAESTDIKFLAIL